ncbi:MAG TPA: shikimate kinase, partial [Gemmatimonadales bacterium]|nr:shikimate kinase [Gemmatimonadales bacterium]
EAATLLSAAAHDIDAILVRRMQMPIERIFGEFGEARFRELEREAVSAALGGPPSVVVPGGGWAAQPGALESVRPAAFLIYVKVPPAVAAARAAGGEARPLLTGPSPLERMRAILKDREPCYLRADAEVLNEGPPAETAAAIAKMARQYAGW